MNHSAFALPPELWIPTLALTRNLSSWLPTSTRFLSRLLQSTPLLDKALRTPVAHELFLAVRVNHTDECFYDGEGYYSHHHVIHHLFIGSLGLSPHEEYTPTSQDGQDHPLQALLCATSSVRNRKNALCDQVYQLLVHPGTISGLLTPRGGQSELLAQESLPELIERLLHRQKEWSSDLTLNPLLLACIYASHFIFSGNTQRLFEVLNRLSHLLPDRAILSLARHAASPLRWSLAAADSLALRNAPRTFCDSAHIGTYVKNLELSFFDFGGPLVSSTEVTELDRPFHMTFAEYVVWLALFYWRVDVAQSLVDRFGIDIVQVTRRVFNQPKLNASVWSRSVKERQ